MEVKIMIYKAYNESASNKNEVFNFISNNEGI